MSDNHFHSRKAAAALLKMARATSDPDLAAKLVQAAADLKDQAGELPPPVSMIRPNRVSEIRSIGSSTRPKGKSEASDIISLAHLQC